MRSVRIPLSSRKYPNIFTIIDEDDYDRVTAHTWHPLWDARYERWGVTRHRKSHEIGPNTVWLHRFITHAPKGVEVDHIDGDPLNNSKSNLRLCSHTENLWNRPARKGGKSEFKGVCLSPHGGWDVSITAHNHRRRIGSFHDERDAARAYDIAARELHGQFAYVNLPDAPEDWLPMPRVRRVSSRFRGVSWSKKASKWAATIVKNKKQIWLGCFDDEREAAQAYDYAARTVFGDQAVLNFADEPEAR